MHSCGSFAFWLKDEAEARIRSAALAKGSPFLALAVFRPSLSDVTSVSDPLPEQLGNRHQPKAAALQVGDDRRQRVSRAFFADVHQDDRAVELGVGLAARDTVDPGTSGDFVGSTESRLSIVQ